MSPAGRALHAEWTKTRTVRSSGWLLAGITILTLGLGAVIAASVRFDGCAPQGGQCDIDATRIALSGVYVGQIAAVVFGVLVASSEYATGTIRTTLAAVPRRWLTLVAKTIAVTGPVLVASLLAVTGSLLVARTVLPSNGFTPAHGYPALSLGDTTTLRACAGTVLYLFLIALIGLGVALIVRNTGAAIAISLSLLFVFPIVATLVSEPRWREWLTEWAPMTAGLAVQTSRGLETMPVGPWQGLAILAAYAGAALAMGGILLEVRDA
ncbi:ABC transporter permease [Kribbella capetownensis]|uniref:ABC transporter permease n=1 Tax=Kribbella capetownensis TaxID=1572659 RepID=A0A4R0K0A9_9ACTN|nr:ABC transporter permease subunit [Kribbella capetownensis]TCC51078.1 ABC transporter permease [Kribbella capetownensis]